MDRSRDQGFTFFEMCLQPLLNQRIIRVLLLQLGEQNLYILKLPGFLPVIDQQKPCLAVGRLALQDCFELLLRSFHLFE
ncbi:hypothetical protein D3C76_951140 [compost metagenome]